MINSDIILSVQDLLDDSGGEEFDASKVSRFLNLASAEITTDVGINRMLLPSYSTAKTLSTGVAYVDLPTDHNYDVQEVIYDPSGDSERRLEWIDFAELEEYQLGNQAQVFYYTTRGSKLYFAGIPTSADNGVTVGIWYAIQDSTYGNNSSETIIGKKAPFLLIYKCAELLSLTSPDLVGPADRFSQKYEATLQRLKEAADERGTDQAKYAINSEGGSAL